MKKSRIIVLIVALVLMFTLIGCGGSESKGTDDKATEAVVEQVATEAPAAVEPAAKVETDFPLLPDAEGLMDSQGTIIYQSKTSLADAFTFYKEAFTDQGLTENEILTVNDETMFQMVFTGSENGKNLVIQTVKLDDSTINVSLRYE